MVKYTAEKIKAMSVHDRHTIWKRARPRTDPEAKEVTKLIEESGLPYSEEACLRGDDPVTLEIWRIVNENSTAMIEATEKGLPAICGVDRLLSEALGVDYGGHNMATATAGSMVAERMRQLGYRNSGKKGKMPPGSIAKTAEIFVPNK
jgi:hypothetical protein